MVFPVKSSGGRSEGSTSSSVDENSGVVAVIVVPMDDLDNGGSHEKTADGAHRNAKAPTTAHPPRAIEFLRDIAMVN